MTQQAYIAETQLDSGVKAGEEYLKTVCERPQRQASK
jgi:hypothetical protein